MVITSSIGTSYRRERMKFRYDETASMRKREKQISLDLFDKEKKEYIPSKLVETAISLVIKDMDKSIHSIRGVQLRGRRIKEWSRTRERSFIRSFASEVSRVRFLKPYNAPPPSFLFAFYS